MNLFSGNFDRIVIVNRMKIVSNFDVIHLTNWLMSCLDTGEFTYILLQRHCDKPLCNCAM